MEEHYYIGVDVGTSSARAALVNNSGQIINLSTHPIKILEPQNEFYEQSSEDIWTACCQVIQSVTADIDIQKVKGIGFDATCSLVVLDKDFNPVSVSPTEDSHWNVMMWMDHRAGSQAEKINQTNHTVLKYVGGTISVEMQTPKLMWLKENMSKSWNQAAHFFDLPDFLTWKATGSLSRSLCSLVCKWTYQADANGYQGWSDSYFNQIGLEDLVAEKYVKIGTTVQSPGTPCGQGLSSASALDMGLHVGTSVATSIVDAHAGGLGCLGCSPPIDPKLGKVNLTSRLPLILGTSSCHMAVSKEPLLVPGVWGPYFSAMVPGLWLNEGGQSASGKLLDQVVEKHPAYSWVKQDADTRDVHIHEVLYQILDFKAKKDKISDVSLLSNSFHVWPDYHGNRSPLADSTLKGMVCGLTLTSGVEDLAVQYLATLQALAYSTRQILEALTQSGHSIKLLYACGGLAKSPLFVQTHADVTGVPVVLPSTKESVLLGAAIIGAVASGDFSSVPDAMAAMGGEGKVVQPNTNVASYHDKKYEVFLKMLADQRHYAEMMEDKT